MHTKYSNTDDYLPQNSENSSKAQKRNQAKTHDRASCLQGLGAVVGSEAGGLGAPRELPREIAACAMPVTGFGGSKIAAESADARKKRSKRNATLCFTCH